MIFNSQPTDSVEHSAKSRYPRARTFAMRATDISSQVAELQEGAIATSIRREHGAEVFRSRAAVAFIPGDPVLIGARALSGLDVSSLSIFD